MLKRLSIIIFSLVILSACDKEDENIPEINANFTASKITIFEGEFVTFTDQSTNNPTSWEWDFGSSNINSSTEQNPTVVFEESGIYNISLTASNENSSDREVKSEFITVVKSVKASFETSDSIIDQGNEITFTDTSVGSPNSWEWNFEGASPASSTESNPVVKYNTPGIYEATLKVTTDQEPEGNISTKEIIVLPTNGLIAYYPFDGDAEDYSGNEFHGFLNNGVSAFNDRNQQSGKAYKFDGEDDHIVTSPEIDENLSNGASFAAWIYISEVGSTARILSNYNGTGVEGACNERIGFVFGITEDQRLNIFYATDGNKYDGRITEATSLEANKWYHVVGTWNGNYSPSGFNLYINGTQRDVSNLDSGFSNCGTYLESTNPFHIGIGECATGPCAPFNGAIDEVRIYDRTLSPEEINALSKS
ncbi:LamG-like jellyroll fold domain-containing protein [Marivirga sp.]|uniref:LamG-like jellyroll fold domain-containing protein n=1 Tax=Marivirga sp. TaxID=2018662 RepID=UPI003DA6DFE3